MSIMNQPVYRDKTPHQIVPQLADEGRYLASTVDDVPSAQGISTTGAPPAVGAGASVREVAAGRATTERSVELGHYLLKGPVRGMFFYLYLMVDLFSRKTGSSVHEEECAEFAADLVIEACHLEHVTPDPHADNGHR